MSKLGRSLIAGFATDPIGNALDEVIARGRLPLLAVRTSERDHVGDVYDVPERFCDLLRPALSRKYGPNLKADPEMARFVIDVVMPMTDVVGPLLRIEKRPPADNEESLREFRHEHGRVHFPFEGTVRVENLVAGGSVEGWNGKRQGAVHISADELKRHIGKARRARRQTSEMVLA